MYRERPSTIPGALVWTRTPSTTAVDVLPDGCMDIIWGSDGRILVAGPDTRTHRYAGEAEVALTGIRLAPGTGPAVLGVAAHELRDARVALADIWGSARVRRVADELATAGEPGRVLEAVASARLREEPPLDADRLREVVRLLAAGRRIAEVAEAVDLGQRQLHRRSLDAFGYGPKTLARILRLGTALDAVRNGTRLADAAADAGYADQAHLTREMRALGGLPPTRLVARPSRA